MRGKEFTDALTVRARRGHGLGVRAPGRQRGQRVDGPLQVVNRHLGVVMKGCVRAGVPGQLLDRLDRRAPLNQVRDEGGPQRVEVDRPRVGFVGDAGPRQVGLDHLGRLFGDRVEHGPAGGLARQPGA
jgi:hypothetical protein